LKGRADQTNGLVERGATVSLGINPASVTFVPVHSQAQQKNKKGIDQPA